LRSKAFSYHDLEKLQQQEQLHHLLEHGHRRPIIQDKSRNARTDTDLLNIVQSQTASMKAHAKHLGKCDVNYAPSGGNLLPEFMHHRRRNKLFRSSLIVK
jgi:hypothetical protein